MVFTKVHRGGTAKSVGRQVAGRLLFQFRLILQFGRAPAVFPPEIHASKNATCSKRTIWSRSCWQPDGSTTLLSAHDLLSSCYWTQVEWHGNSSGNNSRGVGRLLPFCVARPLAVRKCGAAVRQSYGFRACGRQDLLVALLW